MLSRTKIGFLAVTVVAIYFIVSLVNGSPSADTPAVTVDEQSVKVSQNNISVAAANPELMVADRYTAPTLKENKAVTSEERLMEYIRWKHNDVDVVENRLLEQLRWKHNFEPHFRPQ